MDTTDVKIARCHRIGPYRRNGTRAIVVNFHWFEDVTTIMQNKHKLHEGKYVSEDLPDEWLDSQKILRPIMKQALKQEKYRGKVRLKQNKLVIDGRSYGIEEIPNIPKDIDMMNFVKEYIRS